MDPSKFQSNAAGQLVPTVVHERQTRSGLPQQVAHSALAFVPHPLPPALDRERFIGTVSDSLLRAEGAVMRLDEAVATLPSSKVLIKALRRREAQQSSKIENTVATIEEIALVEAGQPATRDEVVEAKNNVNAIEAALASPLPPCGRWLREVHEVLLRGTQFEEHKTPGRFRTHQNWIGRAERGFLQGCRFVPPPPGEVLETCLKQLDQSMNPDSAPSDQRRYPWLIEIAFIHYQFETIHPFRDGNGRVGRMLVNALPCRWGQTRHPIVQVSDFFAEHQQAYYDGLLEVSTRGNWEGWVTLFCNAVASQASSDLLRARCLSDLRTGYAASFNRPRDSVVIHRIIDDLCETPLTTAKLTGELRKISFKTAQSHLERLVAVGFIQAREHAVLGRTYRAMPVINAIEGPLDQLPKPPSQET